MTTDSKIVWVTRSPDLPTFNESIFSGAVIDAIEFAKKITLDTKCIIAQVLTLEGKVLATIAESAIHIPG